MWRYRELLPIGPESPVPPLRVGFTPFYDTPRLAETWVHRRLGQGRRAKPDRFVQGPRQRDGRRPRHGAEASKW
jgi:hypothetical protein